VDLGLPRRGSLGGIGFVLFGGAGRFLSVIPCLDRVCISFELLRIGFVLRIVKR